MKRTCHYQVGLEACVLVCMDGRANANSLYGNCLPLEELQAGSLSLAHTTPA